jgi:hypothetical protein
MSEYVGLCCKASDFSYLTPFPAPRLAIKTDTYRGFPQSSQANTSATFYIIPPHLLFTITYTSYNAT